MQSKPEWLKQLNNFLIRGEPLAVLTITDVKGSSPRATGAKMIVNSQGRLWGTIGGGKLEDLAISDALNILKGNLTHKFQYPLSEKAGQCCGGSVEILIEPLNTSPQLYIFGAGHVGTALANTTVNTVFDIHVIDERAEWCLSPAIHQNVLREAISPLEYINTHTWNTTRSWCVVMTHDHGLDQALVQNLAKLNLRYLGLIGSQTKWRRFRNRLFKEGLSEDQLTSVHCPIGIDIGGETPQEIAISISAEIIKLYYKDLNEHNYQSATTQTWEILKDPCEL
jgi:xanthine dehydrogenase accessory factor